MSLKASEVFANEITHGGYIGPNVGGKSYRKTGSIGLYYGGDYMSVSEPIDIAVVTGNLTLDINAATINDMSVGRVGNTLTINASDSDGYWQIGSAINLELGSIGGSLSISAGSSLGESVIVNLTVTQSAHLQASSINSVEGAFAGAAINITALNLTSFDVGSLNFGGGNQNTFTFGSIALQGSISSGNVDSTLNFIADSLDLSGLSALVIFDENCFLNIQCSTANFVPPPTIEFSNNATIFINGPFSYATVNATLASLLAGAIATGATDGSIEHTGEPARGQGIVDQEALINLGVVVTAPPYADIGFGDYVAIVNGRPSYEAPGYGGSIDTVSWSGTQWELQYGGTLGIDPSPAGELHFSTEDVMSPDEVTVWTS